MCGLTVRPFATAFCASSPAAISTLGFEVLVHEVMAAMSTSPEPRSVPSEVFTRLARSSAFLEKPFSATGFEKSSVNFALRLPRSMRSCGRFGPATDGLMDDRSSSSTVV